MGIVVAVNTLSRIQVILMNKQKNRPNTSFLKLPTVKKCLFVYPRLRSYKKNFFFKTQQLAMLPNIQGCM